MAKITIRKDNKELKFSNFNQVITGHFGKSYGMNAIAAQRYIINNGYDLEVDGAPVTLDDLKTTTSGGATRSALSIIDRIIKELSKTDTDLINKLKNEIVTASATLETADDIAKVNELSAELRKAETPSAPTAAAVVDYVLGLFDKHQEQAQAQEQADTTDTDTAA